MDGLLIWNKIRSEKRRYKNSVQKNPETAKLNKPQTIKKLFETSKLFYPLEDSESFCIFTPHIQPTFIIMCI